MNKWQWTPYTIPLILATAFSITAALYLFWRRRHDPVSRLGMLLLLASGVWMLGSALEAASVQLADKIFWDKVQFVGICIIPTAWLAHSLRYTGRDRYLTPYTRTLLSIVPLTIFLLVITNEVHGLIWSDTQLDTSGTLTVKRVTYGVGLWVYIIYSYILALTGISLLVQTLVRSSQLYRWQGGAILLVVIFVWLVNAVEQVFGLTALSDFELTPLAIGLTAPLIAWIFYRLRLRDIVPVARDAVVESMQDALVVLDTKDYIADLNQAAQRLFGRIRPEILGQPVAQLWPEWPDWTKHLSDKTISSQEVALKQGPEQRTYDMRISPLTDWLGRPVSQVVVLRDITELKRRTVELATILEATKAVSSTLDLEKVLLLIAKQMVNTVGVDGCTLSHWDRQADTVVTWVEWRVNPEWTDKPGNTYFLKDFPATRAVLETRQPLFIRASSPDADAAEVAFMQNSATASLLMLPLVIGDQAIGLIELDDEHERDFTADEMRLCQTLADQAAVAIENARLYEQAQQEIVERKRAEEQIKASLHEKEVLLKEIHHRVKNNLQVISSLLDLQTTYIKDEQMRDLFTESQNRIRSMALVHEKLYQSPDLAQVDLAEYVRSLTAYLFQSHRGNRRTITLELDVCDTILDVDSAIPCGLIINELVSNALKHAFPQGRTGQVHVGMHADQSRFTMLVRDDGVGFPPDLDFRNTESLGLQLVLMLVEQLEGSIEMDNTGGTTFQITFTGHLPEGEKHNLRKTST
jgi:PAS domain S-box-containing protein